jgi:hypothetical protein
VLDEILGNATDGGCNTSPLVNRIRPIFGQYYGDLVDCPPDRR